MKQYVYLIIIFLSIVCSLAAQAETIVQLETKTGTLEGSLLVPDRATSIPVALIIVGSGPTDRDGNNPAMQNNSLKMLANELLQQGISTLRYDKRGIGKSKEAGIKESDLRFEYYINDAKKWVEFLTNDERFYPIIVIGHSEGSLIGMIASQEENVDIFISIAGAGQSADKILKKQLKDQGILFFEIIDKLIQGEFVEDVDPQHPLFRPSVQPYLISWFKYDPQKEIAQLKKPILIIQGTTDIQVSTEDAKMLTEANQKAEIYLIEGMNHIFKEAALDMVKNLETYNQPELPIKPELIEAIVRFIKKQRELRLR